MRIIHPGQVATNRIVPNAGSGRVISVAIGGGSSGGSGDRELLVNGQFPANASSWLGNQTTNTWQLGSVPNEGQMIARATRDSGAIYSYQNGVHPIAGSNCRLTIVARAVQTPIRAEIMRGDNLAVVAQTTTITATGGFVTQTVDFVMPIDSFRASVRFTSANIDDLAYVDSMSLLLLQ